VGLGVVLVVLLAACDGEELDSRSLSDMATDAANVSGSRWTDPVLVSSRIRGSRQSEKDIEVVYEAGGIADSSDWVVTASVLARSLLLDLAPYRSTGGLRIVLLSDREKVFEAEIDTSSATSRRWIRGSTRVTASEQVAAFLDSATAYRWYDRQRWAAAGANLSLDPAVYPQSYSR
jgi:hypothetical protein